MLTQQEAMKILDDTVEYYMDHPRSVVESSCKYRGPNGEVCAVGRLANEEQLRELHRNEGNSAATVAHIINMQDDKEFLSDLQTLHDGSSNWIKTDTGQVLSYTGRSYYNLIVKKIENKALTGQNYGYQLAEVKKQPNYVLPIGNNDLVMSDESKKVQEQFR